ncbi:pks15/1, partial [Symbiodinium sp. CCMP2456]
EKSTAHIRREKCNVADPTQIARLFEETPAWPACAGVVHAAGVLSDGTITKQTRAKYEEVFGPKLHGCYYLHCSRGYSLQKLQVNLVMSSMAGFGGSPGQSNHSCGNTGIESVVDFDRKMGIAGSSIAWGAAALDRGLELNMMLVPEEEEEEEGSRRRGGYGETSMVALNDKEIASACAGNGGCGGEVDDGVDGRADQEW